MAEPFANEPIDVADLPQLNDEAFVSVDPRYLRASLIGIAIAAGVVVIGGVLTSTQAARPWVVAGLAGALLALLAIRAVFRTLEVRRMAYQVRDHDLSMRSGVITHRTSSLPFARVQHVRVHRGAIERALGLATLHVSSAGPNITIPGLADADAERIKLLVTKRAGDLEANQGEPDTAEPGFSPPPPTAPPTTAAPPTAPPTTAPPTTAPPPTAPPSTPHPTSPPSTAPPPPPNAP